MKWLLLAVFLTLTSCGGSEEMARFTNSSTATTIAGVDGKFDEVASSQAELLSRTDTTANQMDVNLDMNGNRILNLPAPISDQEPVRLQDLNDAVINGAPAPTPIEEEGVVNVRSQFGAGDSEGNTPAENLAALDLAVDYAQANGWKKIYLPADTYTISNTWVIPSGFEIYGDTDRLGSQILQNTVNAPVMANDAWANNGVPLGSTYIHNLWLKGGQSAGSNNHGLILYDYFSKVADLYISEAGGYGLYFSSVTSNGTSSPSSTLVENKVDTVLLSNNNNGFRNGDTSRNKLTDGMIENLIINMGSLSGGEVFELYEAAGWSVDNLHTYAHDTALKINAPLAFHASNWYIENRGAAGEYTLDGSDNGVVVNISNMQRGVSFTNFTCYDVLENSDKVFRVTAAPGIDRAGINIANVTAIADANAVVNLVSRQSSTVPIAVNVSNFTPQWTASAAANEQLPFVTVYNQAGASTEYGSWLDNGAELRLRNSLTEDEVTSPNGVQLPRLFYGNVRLPKVSAKETVPTGGAAAAQDHTVVLDMPPLSTADFFEGTLTINLSQNNTGTQKAFWTGRLLVGSSAGDETSWYYFLNKIGTDVNMGTDPTITVNGGDRTITVDFTHTGADNTGTGVVSYSFVDGPVQ